MGKKGKNKCECKIEVEKKKKDKCKDKKEDKCKLKIEIEIIREVPEPPPQVIFFPPVILPPPPPVIPPPVILPPPQIARSAVPMRRILPQQVPKIDPQINKSKLPQKVNNVPLQQVSKINNSSPIITIPVQQTKVIPKVTKFGASIVTSEDIEIPSQGLNPISNFEVSNHGFNHILDLKTGIFEIPISDDPVKKYIVRGNYKLSLNPKDKIKMSMEVDNSQETRIIKLGSYDNGILNIPIINADDKQPPYVRNVIFSKEVELIPESKIKMILSYESIDNEESEVAIKLMKGSSLDLIQC